MPIRTDIDRYYTQPYHDKMDDCSPLHQTNLIMKGITDLTEGLLNDIDPNGDMAGVWLNALDCTICIAAGIYCNAVRAMINDKQDPQYLAELHGAVMKAFNDLVMSISDGNITIVMDGPDIQGIMRDKGNLQ